MAGISALRQFGYAGISYTHNSPDVSSVCSSEENSSLALFLRNSRIIMSLPIVLARQHVHTFTRCENSGKNQECGIVLFNVHIRGDFHIISEFVQLLWWSSLKIPFRFTSVFNVECGSSLV